MKAKTTTTFCEGSATAIVTDGALGYSSIYISTSRGGVSLSADTLRDAERNIRSLSSALNDYIDVIAEAKLHGAK